MENVLEESYRKILLATGEDCQREGLIKTPARAAKAMRYLTSGYKKSLDELVNHAVFKEESGGVICVKDIEFYSLCEHHILPFWGKCHVAYIPDGKIIGLSKMARIVDMYARRLQVQERLSEQIADAVESVLKPKGVAVCIEAQHMCMMMRGVEKADSKTRTVIARGELKNEELSVKEIFW